MNKAEFTDLIKNPEKLGTEHIEILKNIVAEFPYFSTAHILLTKALYNTKHYEYEKQLKITALSVGNRAVLYKFLNNEELELDDEINFMKVPIELKVEKVSKPDFEMSKQEEDAILLEANSILNQPTENSSEELSLSEIKNKIEDKFTTNEEKYPKNEETMESYKKDVSNSCLYRNEFSHKSLFEFIEWYHKFEKFIKDDRSYETIKNNNYSGLLLPQKLWFDANWSKFMCFNEDFSLLIFTNT